MRILQIAPQIPYPLVDGGKIGIYNITKYVASRGHHIDFVAYYRDEKSLENEPMFSGMCTPHFIKHNTRNSAIGALKNIFSLVPYNFAKYYCRALEDFLVDFFKSNDVDVVHVDHAHMAWVIDIIRPLTKAKIVLREHNLELKIMQRYYREQKNIFVKLFAYFQYEKMSRYEPNICSKYDCCIMISEQDEAALYELNKSVKTTIIPVGVDDDLLQIKGPDREQLSISHLGSIEWLPNYDGLAWFVKEIFPHVIKSMPDVKLYLIGKYTEKYPIPPEMKSNIIPLGLVENAFDKVLRTQLTIIPLRIGGGIRVKIFELMAIGQPIISTSIGKEGIEVKNGEHLFIEDDAGDFAERIVSCLKAASEMGGVTSAAKQLIREKYTWKIIAGLFEKIYQK